MKKKKTLINVILCALFAALAFTATNVRIPLPSGGMVHLGNFVVVIASLLCGGIVGGLAGGIGCGLFDLIIYSSPTGFVKYFILKFIMGFLVGSLFRLIIKKKIPLRFNLIEIVLGLVFIVLATLVVVFYISGSFKLSASILNKSLYIGIVAGFGYFFALSLLFLGTIFTRFAKVKKCIIFVVSISVLVNILLEFIWEYFNSIYILNLNKEAALINGLSTMPSCILTGVLSVVLSTLVFKSIDQASKKSSILTELDIEAYEEV